MQAACHHASSASPAIAGLPSFGLAAVYVQHPPSNPQLQADARGLHSTSEAAALGEAEFHTMAGSLSTLLDHHHDSQLAHSLPLSASELNLASWSSPGPGPGDAGDLSGGPQ